MRTQKDHTMVAMNPPMKPSQVFLGDSLINGCREETGG